MSKYGFSKLVSVSHLGSMLGIFNFSRKESICFVDNQDSLFFNGLSQCGHNDWEDVLVVERFAVKIKKHVLNDVTEVRVAIVVVGCASDGEVSLIFLRKFNRRETSFKTSSV
ncbi:hypothetical protein PTT_06544 [Pyrenophora teres f. teres 0-1]|uniref:Uncharacterized protein n=1 Tax=Pyrenophora teres f. teres (strain 0-1) TaxID=861557 RepID=E3RFN0_PYRTT|nr:hypothetical protein PTT_06544 [Pyrenophora teres f. teres 0-1]KAE8837214.1 hypothetical protein HRS9122_07369 [Pyrenophora teres f. teres]